VAAVMLVASVMNIPTRRNFSKSSERPVTAVERFVVVTFASVAGLEAAMAGYPVFASERCCAYPVSAGPLERIETPEYLDRMPWLHSLAYAQWDLRELPKIDLEEYDYTCAS
jgi:hypothetical protein